MRSEHRTHVVIATRLFTPEPAAAALRLKALACALVGEDCEVTVVTTKVPKKFIDHQEGYSKDESLGAQCGRNIRVWRAPAIRNSMGVIRGYIPYLSFDIPLFFRLLFVRGADVIVCEPPPTTGAVVALVSALRKKPYVYYAADILSDAASAQGTSRCVVAMVRWLEERVFRRADGLIAVTEGVRQRIVELADRSAEVVENGIDVPDRKRILTNNARTLTESALPQDIFQRGVPIFLYAGTVASWLGPEIFIEAFRIARSRLQNAKLVYLGQGSAWNSLKSMASNEADIVFCDAVSSDEALAWYENATASLASMRPGAYDYAYPTKILASLSVGTPVIYAGSGQAYDDVRQGRLGIAVKFDVHAIAEAMCTLAEGAFVDVHERLRLREWVEANRSSATSSKAAAHYILNVARR